jgi:hypothetical protein
MGDPSAAAAARRDALADARFALARLRTHPGAQGPADAAGGRPLAGAARAVLSAGAVRRASPQFVQRILDAYRRDPPIAGDGVEGSVWSSMFEAFQRPLDEVLRRGADEDEAAGILGRPGENALLYGVENFTGSVTDVLRRADPGALVSFAHLRLENLRRAALGEGRLLEGPLDPEQSLSGLDAVWPAPFPVPNPYAWEFGVRTTRGVVSAELADAAYLAWRMAQLLKDQGGSSVLEIGGGLGRSAFYAASLGIRELCAVELPLCRAAQAYYLGSLLGEEAVALEGETAADATMITIISPGALGAQRRRFDLVAACNVLAQLSDAWRKTYLDLAAASGLMLSVDRVEDSAAVEAMFAADPRTLVVHRHPAWLAGDLIERVVRFKGAVAVVKARGARAFP